MHRRSLLLLLQLRQWLRARLLQCRPHLLFQSVKAAEKALGVNQGCVSLFPTANFGMRASNSPIFLGYTIDHTLHKIDSFVNHSKEKFNPNWLKNEKEERSQQQGKYTYLVVANGHIWIQKYHIPNMIMQIWVAKQTREFIWYPGFYIWFWCIC